MLFGVSATNVVGAKIAEFDLHLKMEHNCPDVIFIVIPDISNLVLIYKFSLRSWPSSR
jgi:hypothetical protein